MGVRAIGNYVIASINDDGYGLGERSVGVLHLFNHAEGRGVERTDLARLTHVARLVGALASKCQCITSCLTLIIGLTQNAAPAGELVKGLDTSPGSGDFARLGLPLDALRKQASTEQASTEAALKSLTENSEGLLQYLDKGYRRGSSK